MSKKAFNRSPLLDVIIGSDSSMSLNMIENAAAGRDPLFHNRFMNDCILFKYPNFEVQLSEGVEAAAKGPAAEFRPVETAIYVPNDPENLQAGGFAIYLRQRDFEHLLRHHLGLNLNAEDADFAIDVKILRVIDTIPSLDPYLLRSELSHAGLNLAENVFGASEREEDNIRRKIEGRIGPIIDRAVGKAAAGDTAAQAYRKRFIDAIWNPDLPEAELFIKSFGIDKAETQRIFIAWKGITYYQVKFESFAPSLRVVLDFFRGPLSRPRDASSYNRMELEQMAMHVQATRTKLENVVKNCRQIFVDYNKAYDGLVNGDKPLAFKEFLTTAHNYYWILGFCSTASKNATGILTRIMQAEQPHPLRYEELDAMLKQMNALLNSSVKSL
ncbi:MAG: hypothetical protein KKB63_15035 [Alphaproteobacteria bacterium]|nr:hypothetical protein [Alphaproteobacteria bacterium]